MNKTQKINSKSIKDIRPLDRINQVAPSPQKSQQQALILAPNACCQVNLIQAEASSLEFDSVKRKETMPSIMDAFLMDLKNEKKIGEESEENKFVKNSNFNICEPSIIELKAVEPVCR